MKKFAASVFVAVIFSGCAFAAKWKELVFTDNISLGFAELSQYCVAHDVTVADVLWANSVESYDIKAGHKLYLPANHADLLAIWQHKGAWQPTALVPVTSAAAAKRAAKKNQLKEVPMPKIAGIPDLQTPAPVPAPAPKPESVKPVVPEPEPQTQVVAEEPQVQSEDTPPPSVAEKPEEKSNDDIIAMLREEVKTDERNLPPEQAEQEEPETPAQVQPETVAEEPPLPEIKPSRNAARLNIPTKPAKPAKRKQDTPAKVIANTAKPDKILTGRNRQSAKADIPGLMDPIIIFSPNGNPARGPMRLVISGDKVEVVQLPKNAAPKRPSLSDLDHTFGTNPSYLPHYNLTPRKPVPFTPNTGNLAGKMLWPVDGKISSPFGKWRGNHKHQGIDIPMPAGTPIRAAKNGVVSRTGNNSTMGFRGYGNFVLMDHGEGVQTFYAHCLSVAVVQGQRVMQGQIIGYVGNTGRSTANHLHFEVRVNNTKVNPVPYLAGNTSLASNK